MPTVAVIPSRYGSTRLPAKSLLRETGKTLVQHVHEQVSRARGIDRVIVATDDDRIATVVRSFGGEAAMTREDHPSGTSRVGEVLDQLRSRGDLTDEDIILNVQGDEPEVDPTSLDALVARMRREAGAWPVGTLAAPFDDAGPREGPFSPLDPNCVKVVLDAKGRAMYFSRSLIPFARDTGGAVDRPSRWLQHMGVYAFTASTLRRICGGDLPATDLNVRESLEQLSWLYAGMPVGVVVVSHASRGIDTPEDYADFVRRYGAQAE